MEQEESTIAKQWEAYLARILCFANEFPSISVTLITQSPGESPTTASVRQAVGLHQQERSDESGCEGPQEEMGDKSILSDEQVIQAIEQTTPAIVNLARDARSAESNVRAASRLALQRAEKEVVLSDKRPQRLNSLERRVAILRRAAKIIEAQQHPGALCEEMIKELNAMASEVYGIPQRFHNKTTGPRV